MRSFDERSHVDLDFPKVVKYLDKDMNHDHDFVAHNLPSNYGCCSAFKVLSAEGVRVLNLITAAIEKHSTSTKRIPKNNRGVTYRNQFLNELAHSPSILRRVSELAGCEMVYHPMRIQQLHTNLKPQENESNIGRDKEDDMDKTTDASSELKDEISNKKNVDRWHCDTTGFVLVLFCTDPSQYDGGELQYFNGTREEGTRFLASAGKLPANRVLNVGTQYQGFGVFMQGSRVFHQVTPVLRGDERTTIVFSFQPRNVLALEACPQLGMTYNEVDPLHVFLPDWVRYRAWKVMRRMEMWLAHNTELESQQKQSDHARVIVDNCRKNLESITQRLKFSDDRSYLIGELQTAMQQLRSYMQSLECDSDGNGAGSASNERKLNADGDDNDSDDVPARKIARVESDHAQTQQGENLMTLRARHPDVGEAIPNTLPCDVRYFNTRPREELFGKANLVGAIDDIDSCIDDIINLQAAMEYY